MQYDQYPFQTRDAAERTFIPTIIDGYKQGIQPTDTEQAWMDGYTQAIHDLTTRLGIKACRTRRGLTQPKLAEMTGVPRSRISEYESGWRPMDNVNVDTLQKLAVALDVTMEQLLPPVDPAGK